MSPSLNNPYNALIAKKHADLAAAFRFAQGTTPAAGQISSITTPLLKLIQIQASLLGDNVIIPGIAGTKQIYEVVLFNVSAQDILFTQGVNIATRIPLLDLPGFPALTTLILPFSGDWDFSHWDVDTNQPLLINLSVGTPVTGFIRYRVANGTSS